MAPNADDSPGNFWMFIVLFCFYFVSLFLSLNARQHTAPQPCSGIDGTTICAEDMFYNALARRKALRNPNDEFLRVQDVVARYALNYAGVAFALKKLGEAAPSIQTVRGAR